jgi:hypothetical protein
MQANNVSSSFRIALMQGGFWGRSFVFAKNEKKSPDELLARRNLTFSVEKDLL